MVQKEVLKKTKTYGLIALLLAIVLVATIYAYGNTGISPGAPQQPGSSQGTLAQGNLGTQTVGTQSSLQTFTSYDELKNFLNQSSSSNLDSSPRIYFNVPGTYNAMAPAPSTAPSAASLTSQGASNGLFNN